jgi:protein required for attachment to host cells
MQSTCIAVVNATRARLFVFERSSEAGGVREDMVERTDLVNPARRRTASQLFSDTRTRTNRLGGRVYGLDDHVAAHLDELDTEFAREIAGALEQAVRETGAKHLILCASPRMLGTLRAMNLPRAGLAIDELARDYAKLTAPQIHDQLVEQRLLPPPPARLT